MTDDDGDECELFDVSFGLCKRFFFIEFINGIVSSSLFGISFDTGDVFNGRFCVRLNLNCIGPDILPVLFIRHIRSICSSSSLPPQVRSLVADQQARPRPRPA